MKELSEIFRDTLLCIIGTMAIIFILSPFVMIYFKTIRCKVVCTCSLDHCVKSVRVGYAIRLQDHKKYCNDDYEGCWKQ